MLKSVKLKLLLIASVACFAADSRIADILNDLAATRHFEEVAIAPDAKYVAWVEEAKSAIYVKDLASPAAPVHVGAGHKIVWSPDSSRIAFLSDAKQSQLCVVAAKGGRVKQLTNVTGFVTGPQWSPDGSRIAVLFAENAPGGGGPLEPDGKKFVVSAAPGPGDNNWWIAQLYTMPADSATITPLFKPETQIAMPRWSPDGSTIAFIQGLMSDEGFTGGDVFTISATGGKAQNRTPERKASASSVSWLSPRKIIFTEYTGGSSAIATLNLDSGSIERLWQGDENIHAGGNFGNFSLARDGKTAAAIRADWQHPAEIWAGPIGDWKQITHANADHHPQWGQAKSIEWSSDGFSVQGWLLYPHDFDPSKKYPMIVSPHGGPASSVTPHWPGVQFDASILSALGYFVFFPNPRGSYGQGEAFTRANVKDFGYGDLRDVMAGVDAVLTTAPVDPNRLGVTGWSYGGYMTMWTVTQTDRFKAAVAGAGIANWQSYYGENSIDQWMIPYFGASVYDDPAVYAKSAPITFIKRVRTPTLVVVGERDGECPAPQSYEFWHALQTLGVPTELVVYSGEGHMFRQPDHRRDLVERMVAWFEKYLR
jgi:dipeptidyl aminopeptidase/acylaminoacyl peptidase